MNDGDIADFLSWNLQQLPPLTSLRDIDLAAQKIVQVIEEEKIIGIYGDYDVDGTTACALFYRFLQLLSPSIQPANAKLYQPGRLKEGYGLHSEAIDRAIADDVSLLITVDCGITNVEAAQHARERGLDLIITDHHQDGASEMPPALAVINPNRRDEDCHPDLKTLAGVGVAFALCWRVKEVFAERGRECPSLLPLLPLVAVGTVCDMVKLTPMNLKLVRHGLRAIANSPYEGIKKTFPPGGEK